MKAMRIHEDGGPEVLRYEDVADPVAGPGEVLVSLRAASLNHLDLWVRKGLPSVPKPRILGADGAGIRVDTGERVVINPGLEHGNVITVIGEHTDGTHAELIAVPETNVFPLDDSISFETAAAFPLVYETAFRMLVTRAQLRAGEWVLIWGIGGGVATAAFEIARALGAKTLVTSGSEAKLETAREWGADVAVHHADGGGVPRRSSAASTSSSRPSARRPGRTRSPRSSPAAGSSSAARRAARTRRRSCTASGGSS